METLSATPPANIYEAGGELSVAVPIPGAHPNHVEVVVRPNSLRVEATCKYPQARQRYHRRDWQVGAWTLDLDLPRAVDPARSRATARAAGSRFPPCAQTNTMCPNVSAAPRPSSVSMSSSACWPIEIVPAKPACSPLEP